MSDIRQFRIINLTLSKEDNLGIEALLAELSEIKSMETPGIPITPTFFSTEGKFFVFHSSSSISKHLLNNPREKVKLDMNDFTKDKIQLKEGAKSAYFHNDYLKEQQNALGISYEASNGLSILENCIEECLLTHHTDMYFTAVFREIIIVEYENNDIRSNTKLNDIYEKYTRLCAYILMNVCRVQLDDYDLVQDSDMSKYRKLYDDLLQFGRSYQDVISTYVIYRDQVKEIAQSKLGDKEPYYPVFYQRCMLKGYEHAHKRIAHNLDNKEFFDHEFVQTNNSSVIKIFLTPFGCLHRETLVEMAMSGNIDDALDTYLGKNGLKKVSERNLIKKLGTNYVYKLNTKDDHYYYKRRPKNGEYAPFGEQDRESPIYALLNQNQMNLTRSK